ncbi:DNA-formamidopyrimidine glycosylase family protein [Microbacterium sp. P07]|uniref:DNA-formamidopyrimidine glycosylase family protein n=1 Tax=Microbacterium sp. P07 TaxID=3366952 RepID=UPI00374612D0
MPESPEVQALAEILDERLVTQTIAAVELEEFRALKTRARPLDELVGATVTAVRRHGKHVEIATDRASLVISFGRAGWALLDEDSDAAVLAQLRFDSGSVLTVTDAGSFLSLGLSVVSDAGEVSSIAKLGPDPLDPAYTREQFEAALGARRKQLRALVQEQESMAGIGGAYSDEILHLAKLSPVVHAADLSADDRDRLFAAVVSVLTDAAAARRGIPLSQQKAAKVAAMRVHGRAGEACPVCGGTVLDVPGSKGSAQYCPQCQTGGVPLPG